MHKIRALLRKLSGNNDAAPDGNTATGETDLDPPLTEEDRRHFQLLMMIHMDPNDLDSDELEEVMGGMTPEQRRLLERVAAQDPMRFMDPWGDPMAPRHRMAPQSYSHHNFFPSYETRERFKVAAQRTWMLPDLVYPNEVVAEDDGDEQHEGPSVQDHGLLITDAALYILAEGEGVDVQHHTLLRMPSKMPEELWSTTGRINMESQTYNLLMADTSGSMSECWYQLMEGWNTHVAPVLKGRTSIYVFSNEVRFLRSGTNLEANDIDHNMTDLTGALQKMAEEVYKCKEKYVKLFLITDGDHNSTPVKPDEALKKLVSPSCKVVDMFVLGAGNFFPVQYSITLRSALHNGSSNLPSLFWAKEANNMDEQMKNIAACISSNVPETITLSNAGFSLPGTIPSPSVHLNEWLYFPSGSDQLQHLSMKKGTNIGYVALEPHQATPSVLNDVFRQWNTLLIQLHNRKNPLPPNAISLMERLFNAAVVQRGPVTRIRERLAKKEVTTQLTDFKTLMNKLRAILTTERFSNELELADNILSTTVTMSKYKTKVLQMKGHTDQDYQNDLKEFFQVVERQKDAIMALTTQPDDCCRITMTSTLTDLQDPDLDHMKDLNKFDFLKEFTISGIGVFAPMRDSITINPWSFGVKAILGQPYSVVSQVTLENFATINPLKLGEHNKEVQLKEDEANTRFNAVVPIFPPEVAKVMEPLVRTRLYAMCTTFAILKNPHMVDFNVHFAALGVTWVRLLFEYPTNPRPEHVQRRIQSIEATAELYLHRTRYSTYWRMLKEQTAQALMTESTEQVDNYSLRCESLIKPMFILHLQLRQQQLDAPTLIPIIRMMLQEYIGRCLSYYKTDKTDATPYTDFFAEELRNENQRREWTEQYLDSVQIEIGNETSFQLQDFYTQEQVEKAARRAIAHSLKQIQKRFTDGIIIALNIVKVKQLRNVTGAGDVSWPTLRTFVSELGISQDMVEDLFSERSMLIYTVHALQYRSSRERLSKPMLDHEQALNKATENVKRENLNLVSHEMKQKLVNNLRDGWLQAYAVAHRNIVQPMTRAQIVAEAQERGVKVTDVNFDQVYKRYRANVGLMGNACQSRACPFFLMPNCRYNQHSIVERRNHRAFPHNFHLATYQHRNSSVTTIMSSMILGDPHITHSRNITHKTIPHEVIKPYINDLDSLKLRYLDVD